MNYNVHKIIPHLGTNNHEENPSKLICTVSVNGYFFLEEKNLSLLSKFTFYRPLNQNPKRTKILNLLGITS